MRYIDFSNIIWWKKGKIRFKELFKKEVSLKWLICKDSLYTYQLEEYSSKDDKYDVIYSWMVEQRYNARYIMYRRWTNIRFTVSKKHIDRFMNILEKFDYSYSPDQIIVYLWSSLKLLLEENWYHDYEWPIKVYWTFWSINTTKTNIWRIWKADILDSEWKMIGSIVKK